MRATRRLPRAAIISERYELARNFCNKLWNASRFALLKFDGYTPQEIAHADLPPEDRWILSRLAEVAESVTESLEHFRFAEAARVLYAFAWDDFCDYYVEMAKLRLEDPAQRPLALRMLANVLDHLLRLLHPIVPFITEEIWQLLGQVAPQRGLEQLHPATRKHHDRRVAEGQLAMARRGDRKTDRRVPSRFCASFATSASKTTFRRARSWSSAFAAMRPRRR